MNEQLPMQGESHEWHCWEIVKVTDELHSVKLSMVDLQSSYKT